MPRDKPSVDAVPHPLLRFEAGFEIWHVFHFADLRAALRGSGGLREIAWSGLVDQRLRDVALRSSGLFQVRGLMCREGPHAVSQIGDTAVADWLCRQVSSGHLRLAAAAVAHGTHRPVPDLAAQVEAAAEAMQRYLAQPREVVDPAPLRGTVPEAHWVEIELLDEDDCAVPDEPYEVTLPSGRLARGRLDARGHARLEWLGPAGDCTIRFPDLDRRAVGYIGSAGPR